MQTLPDKFTPPPSWGKYPPFSNNQPSNINTAQPAPPWELGPGPADPNISAVGVQAPTGNGYGPVGQGTIGVGNKVTVPAAGAPAQVRVYVEPDGNIYFLDNNSGLAYAIGAGALVPQPAVYNPTK
jgi:hypothetical protein